MSKFRSIWQKYAETDHTMLLQCRAFVGALIAAPIADKISRKRSISMWCVVFMLGTALQVGQSTIG